MPKKRTRKIHHRSGKINLTHLKIVIILISILVLLAILIYSVTTVSQKPKVKKENPGDIYRGTETLDLSKYTDSNGNIQKVDTTIKTINNSDYQYANTTNNFQTFFKNKIDNNQSDDIKIERDNSSITFQVIDQLIITDVKNIDNPVELNLTNTKVVPSPDKKKNEITYFKIYQKNDAQIDVKYSIENYKLREEFTISKFLGTPRIYQKIKLQNAYLQVEGDSINIRQKTTNKLLWFIPKPTMYEQSHPSVTSNDINLDFQCLDGDPKKFKALNTCENIMLIKTIGNDGKNWLSEPKRIYPVTIDPNFQIDNADTASNWISSDPTNFTVSQETTIKTEGTGSVKVVATAATGFWSTNGTTLDAGCTNAAIVSYGINTSCGGATLCVTAHWNDSGCIYNGYSTGTAYNTCTNTGCLYGGYYTVSTPFTYYTGTGSCTGGVDPCYRYTASGTGYLSNGGCPSSDCVGYGTYYTSVVACSWIPTTYSYTAGTSVTKYNGNTACSATGTGTCYKLTGNYTNYVTGACGSSGCTNSGAYQDSTTCSWVGSGGSINQTVTITKAATNLSTNKNLTFWVRSTVPGSYLQFQMGETLSTEQTFPFTITAANTWEQKTWDISGIASTSKDALTKFAFKNLSNNGAFIFYFDDIQATADTPVAPDTCVIDEDAKDGYLIPRWADRSSNESGFQLEKNTDGAGWVFLINLAVGVTAYQDNAVSSNHSYAYRVRSYIAGTGGTEFSTYCNHPTLDLHTGDFKFNGVKINGIKLN